jgi:hypothetical protein
VWAKLDDRYADHPKVVGLSDAAFRLHVRAMCYAAAHMTDGALPGGWLRGHEAEVAELVSAGLLVEENDGCRLHDWLEHNISRQRFEERKRKTAERVTAWRREHGYGVSNGVTNGVGNGVINENVRIPPNPNPNPNPIREEPKRERVRFAPPTLSEVQEFWTAEKLRGDPTAFYDHFQNTGWRLSGGKGAVMRDWRLSARNWSRNEKGGGNGKHPPSHEEIAEFNRRLGPGLSWNDYADRYRKRFGVEPEQP